MALIKCPKCGKEISDKAEKCVGCGWIVNLNVLSVQKENGGSGDKLSRNNMLDIENERKRMLKEAEIEIEKMKQDAQREVQLMNESAKAMAAQRQNELELEYKKKEKELARQKEILEKSQREWERTKEEKSSELKHVEIIEKKTNLPNKIISIFMLIVVFLMIGFMFIVWKKLGDFSTEMEQLVSNKQIKSEISLNETDNTLNEESDVIVEGKSQDKDESQISDSTDMTEENSTGQETEKEENNSGIEVTYDSCKTGRFTELIFTIKNVSNENILVSVNSYQYINDVAVKNFGIIEYNSEIPVGKASVVNYAFDREDVSFANINKIEFSCKSSKGTDAETENTFVFDNLDINIK